MAEVMAPDGRTLAYLETGDLGGPLVLHNHGGPGSRLEARLLADAAAKNHLRLVCVDRPGMGQATAKQIRNSFAKQIRNGVNDYDRQILLRHEVAKDFADSCAECFAHGSGDEILRIAAEELGAP